MSVEKHIEQLDSPMKEIVVALRKVVTKYSDELNEAIKWQVPTYSRNKNVCSIIAHKRHVNFQIMHGAHIDDENALEGTGVSMRHMKFSTIDEIDVDQVEKYLKRAIEFDNRFA